MKPHEPEEGFGDIVPGVSVKSVETITKHFEKSKNAAFIKNKTKEELKSNIEKSLSKKMYDLKSEEMDELIRFMSGRFPPNVSLNDYKKGVSNLIHEWAATSGDTNPRSIMIQLAAKKEFGLKGTTLWWEKEALKEAKELFKIHEKAIRRFLREMYNDTQSYLVKQGLKTVRVVRGYKGNIGIKPSVINNSMSRAKIQLQPVSSFSANFNTAISFSGSATIKSPSSLIFAEIPANRILSCPVTGFGCKKEFEYVVLGSQKIKGEKVLASMITKKQKISWDKLFGEKGTFMGQEVYTNVEENITKEIFKRTK